VSCYCTRTTVPLDGLEDPCSWVPTTCNWKTKTNPGVPPKNVWASDAACLSNALHRQLRCCVQSPCETSTLSSCSLERHNASPRGVLIGAIKHPDYTDGALGLALHAGDWKDRYRGPSVTCEPTQSRYSCPVGRDAWLLATQPCEATSPASGVAWMCGMIAWVDHLGVSTEDRYPALPASFWLVLRKSI
jgi:hypothetical protein